MEQFLFFIKFILFVVVKVSHLAQVTIKIGFYQGLGARGRGVLRSVAVAEHTPVAANIYCEI